MSDENPVITCTQMQLAFVAWQCKRAGMTTDTSKLDLDKDGASASAIEFRAWWDKHQDGQNWVLDHFETGFTSLKNAVWLAWASSQPLNQPNHGDLHHFEHWWKIVVLDAQPVIGAAQP